jgi:hypothetical protein
VKDIGKLSVAFIEEKYNERNMGTGGIRTVILVLGVKKTLQIKWLYMKTSVSEVNNISHYLKLK